MRAHLALFAAIGLLATGCTGSIGDPEGKGTSPGPGPLVDDTTSANLRRLRAPQYRNAVRDLLGDAAALAASPPPDAALNGFDAIGASQLALSDDAVRAYEASARGIATAALGDAARIAELVACDPTGPLDEICHGSFIERFGLLAWRRPLDAEEISRYVAVATSAAAEYTDFYAGVAHSMGALLQSPNFLYQVEIGAPDLDHPGTIRLTSFEMASRLSFFLLDTTPDAALLDAAAAGELDTSEGLRDAAGALVGRTGARAALAGLFDEVMHLRQLETLTKSSEAFPGFSPELSASMRREVLSLIDDVVWERDADVRDLLDADYTFVDERLAALYGVEVETSGEDMVRVVLPPEQKRGGILGQAAFLSLFAHQSLTSPTLRGRFVRERLLCQTVQAPPNDVETELPKGGEGTTMREKLAVHQENPSCAGCHMLMDNIGFGLEKYDGIGAFRTTDNGADIDAVSELDDLGTFEGSGELGGLLRAVPEVTLCLARNVFRHATGRVESKTDLVAIAEAHERFASGGYRMKELLVELVASPAFRAVGPQD